LHAIGNPADNAEEYADDFLVVAEEPDLGHVDRGQDAYLIVQSVDENSVESI
jgi:hypothetical protein